MRKWYIMHEGLAFADTWRTRHNNKRKALKEWREHGGVVGKKIPGLTIWRA